MTTAERPDLGRSGEDLPHAPADSGRDGLDFPSAEYERRVEKVVDALATSRASVLLVADEVNYRYLSGHHTEAWRNHSRRRACLISDHHDPVLVVPPGEARDVRECSPWSSIREYDGPMSGPLSVYGDQLLGFEPNLVAAIVDTARELGVKREDSIAIAMGGWAKLDVPFGVIQEIERQLGNYWLDASSLLWEARMVKSEAEIAYMREAVRVLDRAYARTFGAVVAGMSEIELARTMHSNIYLAGADHAGYTIAVSDVSRPRAIGASPSNAVVASGSLLLIDAGAIIKGYTSDYSRMAVVGLPSAHQRDAYAKLAEAQQAGIAEMRPGNTVAEVARAMYRVLDDLSTGSPPPVGRLGHGAGLEVPEPPSLHLGASTVLREGMILCVEPNLAVNEVGSLVVEDMLVVRDDGAEQLSTAPTPHQLNSL